MNDIIVFEYYQNWHNKGGYGKLVNKIKGFRNHYASTLMFKLSGLGYKESHRVDDTKNIQRWGQNYTTPIVRCIWYKNTTNENN